jgi:hypothetical protein
LNIVAGCARSPSAHIAAPEDTVRRAKKAGVDYRQHIDDALTGSASDIAAFAKLHRITDPTGSLGHAQALYEIASQVGDARFAAGIKLLPPGEAMAVFFMFKEAHSFSSDREPLEKLLPLTVKVFEKKIEEHAAAHAEP